MKLTLRDGLHLGLLVPILAGLGMTLFLFTKSTENDLTNQSFVEVTADVWGNIFRAIPASMPGEYPDEENLSDNVDADDLPPATANTFAGNNAFIVVCTLLVLSGCLGLTMATAAGTLQEPRWNAFLRSGLIITTAFVSFFLYGFNLAFPGDHFGIFPKMYFGFPGSVNAVEYGLSGISEWSDLIYIASYAALIGCVLITFCSAGQTASSSLLIGIPVLSLFFPFVLSWKWGAGWIDQLLNSTDFAGAALVHWHVGSVALLIGAVLTVYRKQKRHQTLPPLNPFLYLPGGVLYWLGILGLNAGSTLTATPDLVASVIQSTALASIASGIIAFIFWVVVKQGSLNRYVVSGFIAGAISVSGGADGFDANQSVIIGTLTGACLAGVLFLFVRLKWADPLAVGAIHGLGGFIAIFAACTATFEEGFDATFLGQLVLMLTVPIMSVLVTAMVLLFAGATGFMIYEKKKLPRPPSLPGTP